jgi:predicted metal-binding membrane protein
VPARSALLLGRPSAPVDARAWLRTIGRPGPERWVWPVAAAGWAVLVWAASDWFPLGASAMPAHHHPGMEVTDADPGAPGQLALHGVGGQLALHYAMWIAMVAATMLPLIAWNLRVVGLRSPLPRRTRATLEVVAGWSVVWLAAGLVVTVVLVAAAETVPPAATIVVACAAAVAWQFTRARKTALARCHQTFAPPLGPGATSACLRFGRSLGRNCALSCAGSMLMMAVAGHGLLAVVALAWLSWRDVRRPHDRPATASSVAVLVGVGALALAFQV